MKTIGERVNFLRKNNGLTYNDLALKLRISGDGIRKAIVNNYIKPNHIKILCEEFNWDKTWVLTGDNSKAVENIMLEPGFNRSDLKSYIDLRVKFEVQNAIKDLSDKQKELREDLTKVMLKIISN